MQDLESYVKSNYSITNAAGCSIAYGFSTRTAIDRKSKVPVKNYNVSMKLTWFDSTGKDLATEKLNFINDTLSKASEKQLHTINPGDTTNKFRAAKPDIVRLLIKAKHHKINELLAASNALCGYLGHDNDIIPHEMKSTLHIADSAPPLAAPPAKQTFDM